jgi:hypothetical protein
MWEIALTKRALKDAKKVTRAGLKPKVDELISILNTNPGSPVSMVIRKSYYTDMVGAEQCRFPYNNVTKNTFFPIMPREPVSYSIMQKVRSCAVFASQKLVHLGVNKATISNSHKP